MRKWLTPEEEAQGFYRCYDCGEAVVVDDAVWIDPITAKATTGETGRPFHVKCAPEEKDYEW